MNTDPNAPIPAAKPPRLGTPGLLALALALAVGAGATWLVTRTCGNQGRQLLAAGSDQPSSGCSMPAASGGGMGCGMAPAAASGQAAHPGKVLFYRNPMNPSITSPVFRKDGMGMDYIPVYGR